MVRIVPESAALVPARDALLDGAMGVGRRRKTSERLREGRLPARGLAFAAIEEGRLVGTIRLWNVCAGEHHAALLLGPLAVDPTAQGTGIGSALMRHALGAAAGLGHGAVLLVGDEPYYGRFGFEAGLTVGLTLPGPVERHRFLGLELLPDALAGAQGMVAASGETVAMPVLPATSTWTLPASRAA